MDATRKAPKVSLAERLRWNDIIAPWLVRLLFLGVGLLIGLYMLAPGQNKATLNYMPPAYTALPNGVVEIANPDGIASTLPVVVADTSTARSLGFAGVGPEALDNQLMLYVLTRETTTRATYAMADVRANVQLAAIDAAGDIVSITDVPMGTVRATVSEPHRWLLAAKAGTLNALGIGVGSKLNVDAVRKVNY